jgi:hypothetical protein
MAAHQSSNPLTAELELAGIPSAGSERLVTVPDPAAALSKLTLLLVVPDEGTLS